jgi:ABC-2 type transport system ATP-binding protein
MLSVKNITRSYGDFVAVDDVSFSIGSGEIVGLLGHNGAGKTTAMKMISGYLEPDSGEITVNDRALVSNLKSVQSEIGYLPENLPVYADMTVVDYLDYAADLKRLPARDKTREIKRVVTETDLADKLIDPIATLSRGYKQRTGVAQAILGQSKLLILDEPTNGLDPSQTDQMRQLLRRIAESATVILSTHIMQEVEALCDRVLIMSSGKLVVDENLQNLQLSDQLRVQASHDKRDVKKLMKSIDGIRQIQSLPNDTYAVTLSDNADHQQISAAIANTLITEGANLFSLTQQQRDIETLFREVNQSTASRNSKALKNKVGSKNAGKNRKESQHAA